MPPAMNGRAPSTPRAAARMLRTVLARPAPHPGTSLLHHPRYIGGDTVVRSLVMGEGDLLGTGRGPAHHGHRRALSKATEQRLADLGERIPPMSADEITSIAV